MVVLPLTALVSSCLSPSVEGGDAAHTTTDGQLILERVGLFDDEANGVIELALETEPGEYVFYCNVAHHRSAGMEGTITVR